MARGIKTRNKGKVKSKRRNGAPSGRDTITKGNLTSELILLGIRASGYTHVGKVRLTDEAIEMLAYGGRRHDYKESNKALVVTPPVRAIFDAVFADVRESFAE